MNNAKSQIKIGMFLSYINIIVGNLIPIFYTPIMLNLLGQNEYGLYKIATNITSYLSIMTLGLGSSVSRFLIKANVEQGKESEEKTFGMFNIIFSIIAFFTLIIGFIISFNLDILYHESLSDTELSTMKILVALMVINTAISFSSTAYLSIVSSHERFIFIHSINILSTVVAPIINLVLLFSGYKSVAMSIASLAICIFIRILYLVYVRITMQIKPKYKNLPFSILKNIFSYSFWVFLATIVSNINTSTDTIIIGATPSLGTSAAAIYSIGYTFVSIIFSFAQITPSFFTPMVNKIVFSNGSNNQLSDLMIKAGRFQCFVVCLLTFGFIAFGQPFINMYAGSDYIDGYWVAVIIMIPNCIPLMQSVANATIHAKNLHKFRTIVYIFIAIFNLMGTLLLVESYGIIGAAIPTAISYIVGQGIIMNIYYWKRVGLDIPRFWKNVLPCILISVVLCVFTLFISKFINFYQLNNFIVGVAIYTIVYIIALWNLILNEYEKSTCKDILYNSFNKLKIYSLGRKNK